MCNQADGEHHPPGSSGKWHLQSPCPLDDGVLKASDKYRQCFSNGGSSFTGESQSNVMSQPDVSVTPQSITKSHWRPLLCHARPTTHSTDLPKNALGKQLEATSGLCSQGILCPMGCRPSAPQKQFLRSPSKALGVTENIGS